MDGRSAAKRSEQDSQMIAKREAQRRKLTEDLAVVTAAELHEVESLIDDIKGVLNSATIARAFGSFPMVEPNSLAQAVTNLVEVLLSIIRSEYNTGHLSHLRSSAKKHFKDLTQLKDGWDSFKEKNDARSIRKEISRVCKDLTYDLRRIEKSLSRDVVDLNKKLKEFNQ